MDFSVCGIKGTDHPIPEKLTDVPLSNVLQDKSTNLRILVHLPPANNDHGAAYPQVVHNSLMSPTTWATYYPISAKVLDGTNKMRIADFKHRRWAEMDIDAMVTFVNTHYKVFDGTDAATNAIAKGGDIIDVNQVMAATLNDDKGNPCAVEMIVVRPTMTAMMQSAILATDVGKDSGELLMAYASTGIETNQTGETFRM